MEKGGNYYEFFYNTRLVKPTILHFQVCGLLMLYLIIIYIYFVFLHVFP